MGKTQLKLTFLYGTMSERVQPTLGMEYFKSELTLKNGRNVSLTIWDSSGQEQFRPIVQKYFQDRHQGVFFVYDVNNIDSFKSVKQWHTDYFQGRGMRKGRKDITMFLIGTKTDIKGR